MGLCTLPGFPEPVRDTEHQPETHGPPWGPQGTCELPSLGLGVSGGGGEISPESIFLKNTLLNSTSMQKEH